jgi:hypothetical protein
MIQEYKHRLLSSKSPIMVHSDFVEGMDLFCKFLEMTNLTFFVTSSGRMDTHVPGAIVKPASHGCHLIFCAVDGNLIEDDGTVWTSEKLKKEGLSGKALEFVDLIRNSGVLRWGGDFHPDRLGNTDPVHYDNDMFRKNPTRWLEIYNEIHNSQAA